MKLRLQFSAPQIFFSFVIQTIIKREKHLFLKSIFDNHCITITNNVLFIANLVGKWKYLIGKVAKERNDTRSESPHRHSLHIPLVRSKFNSDVFISRKASMYKNTSLDNTLLTSSYQGWTFTYPTHIQKIHCLFISRRKKI